MPPFQQLIKALRFLVILERIKLRTATNAKDEVHTVIGKEVVHGANCNKGMPCGKEFFYPYTQLFVINDKGG